jgi:predicted site-specific integrase-resolvase
MPTQSRPIIEAFTVGAAATTLQVSVFSIYRYIREGKLDRMHLRGGNAVLVSAKSVARLAAKRGGAAA